MSRVFASLGALLMCAGCVTRADTEHHPYEDGPTERRPDGTGAHFVWPDLRPTGTSSQPGGTFVRLFVTVRNRGDGRAGTFSVDADVMIDGQPKHLTATFFPLDPGETGRAQLFDRRGEGDIDIPATPRPLDLTLDVTVDPVSASQPHGAVLESDESNNANSFVESIP